MSAPLVVNTKDGVCWTRRTVTASGIALYAPESVRTCPQFVMATQSELAERGITGTADVLPVPVGPEPRMTPERLAAIAARAEAATPGPWGFYDGDNYADVAADLQMTGRGSYSYREKVARLEDENYWDDVAHENDDEGRAPQQMTANAAFIAHAREDVPALLAEVERLRKYADQAVQKYVRDLGAYQVNAELFRERITELEQNLRAVNAGWGVSRARVAELEAWKAADEEVQPHREATATANMHHLARLELRLRKVRFLHVKHTDSEHCQHDGESWPCPTVATLDEPLGEVCHPCGCPKRFVRHVDGCPARAAEVDGITRRIAPTQALLEDESAEVATGYPPALPWAHAMSDTDLAGFLDDLVSAALDRWRTGPNGEAYPDRGTLAAIERACALWRRPGLGYRSDEAGDAS